MSERKNILFFADRLPPLIGGMEMHAKYFIEHFTNHVQFPLVKVITKNQVGEDSIVFNNQNIAIDINKYSKILATPHIIFFNSGRWIEELKQLRYIFPYAKFIYRTGGNEILKASLIKKHFLTHQRRQAYWVQTINNNVDILITNSLYTETRLTNLGVTTIFKRFIGGVNVANLQTMTSKKNSLVTIFCAARFVPYKHHEFMIAVINELVQNGMKFIVKLAGDGALLNLCKKQVAKYNLASVIEFLGPLNNYEVCKEICNSDIYMQFSKDTITQVEGGTYIHSEGMGRSILEALSAGIFVIAGKSGALPEIIKPKQGLLIDLNQSVKAIANQIQYFIKNPPPKRTVKSNFGWDKIFTGYEELFQDI